MDTETFVLLSLVVDGTERLTQELRVIVVERRL